jgi:hypothetical protein
MLLNDDPGIIDAPAREAEPPASEPGPGRESGAHWQWLFPWLLAFAGMLITLALSR